MQKKTNKSTENDSDDRYISENDLEYIQDRSQIHPDINARYTIFKIHDRIRQTQNEWKGSEISAKSMSKVLHKIFKDVVDELKSLLYNLVE